MTDELPTLFDAPDDRKPWQRSRLESPDAITSGIQHRHPHDTEAKAAKDVTPRTGTARALVLVAIREGNGLTDEEVQLKLGMNPSTERPRRVELVEGGYVEDGGNRRLTSYGAQAIVWVATGAGRAWSG